MDQPASIRCSRCKQHLPETHFTPSARAKRVGYCAPCSRAYNAAYRLSGASPIRRLAADCFECGAGFEVWRAGVKRCQPCYDKWDQLRHLPVSVFVFRPKEPLAATVRNGKPTGKRWEQLRQQVFAEETHCAFCGEFVDQSLKFPNRSSRCVDHFVPLAVGGDVWTRENVRLAHFGCNSSAQARSGGISPIDRDRIAALVVAFARAGL